MLSVPVAVFQCCPESIFFEERKITFTGNSSNGPGGSGQVKIGRAIAQLKARPDNLIFDCKVLSRNHALLWYDNGKFLLQDTKSSNGTFVNNAQIPSEESTPPTQVYSRDYIQFGISVVDNDTKVTHGCIVAQAFLYHADGREALKESNADAVGAKGQRGSSQALACSSADARLQGQLARYLKEALAREQMLDKKIRELQALVVAAQQSSESAWQASVDEERLLTRLEMLEEQLTIYKGHYSEEDFRAELCRLKQEQMHSNIEGKDSLCHALEEKTRAVVRMAELENKLSSTEEECERLRQACQQAEDELVETIDKLNTKLDEVEELKTKLQAEENTRDDTVRRLETEKTNLMQKLEEATQNETALTARLSTLLAEKEQLIQLQNNMKSSSLDSNGSLPRLSVKQIETDSYMPLSTSSQSLPLTNGIIGDENCENGISHILLNGKPVENGIEERQNSTEKINELEMRLEEGQKSVATIQAELENSQAEAAAHLARIATLEVQLAESEHQVNTSRQIKQQLQDRIGQLEMELSAHFSSAHSPIVENAPNVTSHQLNNGHNALVESSGDSDLSSETPHLGYDSCLISPEEMLELKSENERFRQMLESLKDENAKLLRDVEELKLQPPLPVSTPNGPATPNHKTNKNNNAAESAQRHNRSLNSTSNSFNESFVVSPPDEHYWRRLLTYCAVFAVVVAVLLAYWQSD